MGLRRVTGWAGGYPSAAAIVAVMVGVCLPLRGQVPVSTILLALVPVILVIARFSGTAASVFASFLTVVVIDVVFTKPYFQLTVSDPTEWVALVVFLTVALVAGGQTGELRRRELSAIRRDELLFLNQLLFSLASEGSLTGTVRLAVNRVMAIMPADRVSIYAVEEHVIRIIAEEGDVARPSELACAEWVASENKAIGLPGSPEADQSRPVNAAPEDRPDEAGREDVVIPLQTTQGAEGILYVRIGAIDAEDVRALVAISNLLGALLERNRIEVEASGLAAEREVEQLKATLVSSVSHELKTPLSAATAHVSGLLDEMDRGGSPHVEEELGLVAEELARLNVSISDLLDLARLETSSWKPRPDTYEISEVLATTLSRLSPEHQDRVRFSIPADAPFVYVDFTQMVQVFLNILQNALVYSAQTAPVRVVVSCDGEWLQVAIEDEGPGVPDSEKQRVFDKFYRGSSAKSSGGTGLGLAITREIVTSAGGTVAVEDAAGGGARFVVSIPVAVIGVDDE